jgi:hypothetical protein
VNKPWADHELVLLYRVCNSGEILLFRLEWGNGFFWNQRFVSNNVTLSLRREPGWLSRYREEARYRLVRVPPEARNFPLLRNVQTYPRTPSRPTQAPVRWVLEVFAGRKAYAAWICPIAEVKNEWSYTATPYLRLRNVERDSFSFNVSVFRLQWTLDLRTQFVPEGWS